MKILLVWRCDWEDCSKIYQTRDSLRRHEKLHTNKSSFHCPRCHKRFNRKSHLNYHFKSHYPQVSIAPRHCQAKSAHVPINSNVNTDPSAELRSNQDAQNPNGGTLISRHFPHFHGNSHLRGILEDMENGENEQTKAIPTCSEMITID